MLENGSHRKVLAALFAAALAASVAGCSSNDAGSSSTDAGTASSGADAALSSPDVTFTGEPVTLGLIVNVGAALDNPQQVAATKGGVRSINSRGGINGHEVKLLVCNESLDPNKARACARQMVDEHVMATVGNGVATAEADVNKILSTAGIPQVGTSSFSGASTTDPNNYMLTPGIDYANVGMARWAAELTDNGNVAQLALDSPITAKAEPMVKGVVDSLGGTFSKTVPVPLVTSDLSTQAAALIGLKPDAVVINASGPAALGVITNMHSLGYTGKFISPGAQFYQSDFDTLGDLANQIAFAAPFPPVSATDIPGIKQFRDDMAAEKSSGDGDAPTATEYEQSVTMSAWLATVAVERIANAAGATDATTLKTALDTATDVDLGGVIPAWTPNKAAPGSAVPRASNGTFYFSEWKDGKNVLKSNTPTDITALVAQFLPK